MHAIKVLTITIPRLAGVFSDGSLFNFCVLFLRFSYFAITRKRMKKGEPMSVSLHYAGKAFNIRLVSTVDLAVLDEVFLRQEYKWALPFSPRIIIDLGAHFGDTALYYHAVYPEATIIAVEPSPSTFERLRKNTQHVEQIVPVQAGISDNDGMKDLYTSPSSIGDSFIQRDSDLTPIPVHVYSLSSLLAKYGIARADLIKFDIEGAEELLFRNVDLVKFSRAYIGEVHEDLMSISVSEFLKSFKGSIVEIEKLENTKRMIVRCLVSEK